MLFFNDDGLFIFIIVFGCFEKLLWMENNINLILKIVYSNLYRMNYFYNECLDFF